MLQNIRQRKSPPVKETVRHARRDIAKGVKGMDAEIRLLKVEEKKLLTNLKQEAKLGNMKCVQVLARSLVKNRKVQQRLQEQKAQLTSVSSSIQGAQASVKTAEALGGGCKAMQALMGSLDTKQVQREMEKYSVENHKMDMAQETMSEAIDSTQCVSDDEDTDEILNEILDGVAVDNSAAMKAVPRGQAAVVAASAEEGGATGADADSDASESTAIDDELRARLENLRKPGEAP
mmetsp:Transcript_18654/g.56380  ORF Transcript_18654/g.56380 Transcript_18654/m.56380 type:complete len:234 (-) Transcript_18654:562-1263(-)